MSQVTTQLKDNCTIYTTELSVDFSIQYYILGRDIKAFE